MKSGRSQHARAQVWVYGFIALAALSTLGTSLAGIAVSRVRQRGFSRFSRFHDEEYYPGWEHLIMAAVWAGLLTPYACY